MNVSFNEVVVNIEYKGSVQTPAGHRSVYFKGTASKISEKRVKVIEITHIDDEPVCLKMSRTGANRQSFNGVYFAAHEAGKLKNISSLFKISE